MIGPEKAAITPWPKHLSGGLRARWKRLRQALFRARHADTLDLLRAYPDLRPGFEAELKPAYQRYVNEVSSPVAAISLELSCFLLYLCRKHHPTTILDLGSGFSSFVFRRYQQESTQPCTVYSCDDNPFWLEKTSVYLESNQLSNQHLYDWDSFREEFPHLESDLILFDLSSPTRRVGVLPLITNYLTPRTLLCVDDVHKALVRDATEQLIRAAGLRYADLSPCSLDQFGRFSWLLFDSELQTNEPDEATS